MKLKPIPENTVVHTPTEEEANELLAILHANGYKWCAGESLMAFTNWELHQYNTYYSLNFDKRIKVGASDYAYQGHFNIVSFADFKCLYCDGEKPALKFNSEYSVGEVVEITGSLCTRKGQKITLVRHYDAPREANDYNKLWVGQDAVGNTFSIAEKDFKSYAEPTEAISQNSTRNCDNENRISTTRNKELNLSELLKGHEGETFYSPVCGTVIELKEVFKSFLVFYLDKDDDCTIECETRGWQRIGTLDECGVFKSITYPESACLIFPSRVLYEQYPLDPYTAWMKWKEEQKKWKLRIGYSREDSIPSGDIMDLFFRTTADRDKCIEEIKAIIEKYSKE